MKRLGFILVFIVITAALSLGTREGFGVEISSNKIGDGPAMAVNVAVWMVWGSMVTNWINRK